MRLTVYISSHGFGHLTRCLAFIYEILDQNSSRSKAGLEAITVTIKCAKSQISFAKNYLKEMDQTQIIYCEMMTDVGTLVVDGTMEIDRKRTIEKATQFVESWPEVIGQEIDYYKSSGKPDGIVVDIVPWACLVAKELQVPSIAISNFTWLDTYKKFMPEDIMDQYRYAYEQVDRALAYEFAMSSMKSVFRNSRQISLIARRIDEAMGEQVKKQFHNPMVYISIGKLVSVSETIDVSKLPYSFVITEGLHLVGDNVYTLSLKDNAQAYLSVADYVITKPGWSTTAEALLMKKPLALMNRADSEEDTYTLEIIEDRQQCIRMEVTELEHLEAVVERMRQLPKDRHYEYTNDAQKIAQIVTGMLTLA